MKKNIDNVIIYILLVTGAMIMIFPFFWMFSSAFKTAAETASFPPTWIPSTFKLDNFIKALGYAPFGKYFVNSLIVTIINVTTTSLTTILEIGRAHV